MTSSDDLLCLHAIRLLGAADTSRIAGRFGLDHGTVHELVLDFQATGLVSRSTFFREVVWSLTDAGRMHNERMLAEELDRCEGRTVVESAHETFVRLNANLQAAVTDWQLQPAPGGRLTPNDHTDFRWDDRVLRRLQSIGRELTEVCDPLTALLTRFDGYAQRYTAAALRAGEGQTRWVDTLEIDSCHTVWMQLHEDLLASLGLRRGQP